MNRWVKRISTGVGVVLGIVIIGGGGFVYAQTSAFDSSMEKVWDVPLKPVPARSTDAKVLERGKHLAESMGACATGDCHGADLAGGRTIRLGPIGEVTGPNITSAGGIIAQYSDEELARLIRHGIKRDGRSVRLMPSQDFGWMSMDDVGALISYVRSVPSVDKPNGPCRVGVLGKILDRQGKLPLDVAGKIDHAKRETDVPPNQEPTAAFGKYLAEGCRGCHGATLSGGPIPGAPPSMPIPRNITPHDTGLKTWSFEDFEKMCNTGTSKDGRALNKMMPFEALSKCNDTEKHALWAYLQSVPPVPFGNR